MEMDLDALLDELWSCAVSAPKELETKIRSCLKSYSSEGLLQAISLLITQGQYATARALLTDFLKNHQSADDLQYRLEQVLHFKKQPEPQILPIKTKQRSKELLIKDVNDLVASGKLQAAESLLLELIETVEDHESLNLLSRVYMLQRRPIDGARAMQRALLLKRQQQSFVEIESEDSIDDLPTESDLAFLNNSAKYLPPLENPTASINEVLTKTADDSLTFIQNAASQYPSLITSRCWEEQPESTHSECSSFLDEPGISDAPGKALVTTDDVSGQHVVEDEKDQSCSVSTKTILKLAHPRGEMEAGEGLAKVKIFNKSRRSQIPSQLTDLWTPEPSDSNKSLPRPTILPVSEVPASPFQTHDEISDENDEDVEYTALTELALNTPTAPYPNCEFEDPEDSIDLDHDLQDLSIYEFEAEQEEDIPGVEEDFRDLDDDYAAYAFDPDEIFDSKDAETDGKTDGGVDKLSREDRALQRAADLIGKANWPISNLPLVQQIFVMSGWGATRLALEREIEKGLTPEELILAAHIKVIWAENDIYWIAFDKTGSSRLSYYVLSWPTALLIVRSFESLPQVEEIEIFLENLFASWYENNTLRHAFKAFARYLWFRFANLEGCLPASQHFDFRNPCELPAEEYSDLGLCDTLEIEKTERLREFGVFQTKHPQEPSCYFSDKYYVREEEPNLNASGEIEQVKADIADTESLTEIEDDTAGIDGVEEDASVPQWSAAPLASALHASNTD